MGTSLVGYLNQTLRKSILAPLSSFPRSPTSSDVRRPSLCSFLLRSMIRLAATDACAISAAHLVTRDLRGHVSENAERTGPKAQPSSGANATLHHGDVHNDCLCQPKTLDLISLGSKPTKLERPVLVAGHQLPSVPKGSSVPKYLRDVFFLRQIDAFVGKRTTGRKPYTREQWSHSSRRQRWR